MKKILGIIYVAFCFSSLASPPVGSFSGVFTNAKLNQDQLAEIELIPYQTEKQFELKAVLRLHFGDFSSTEYLTYRFDSVGFDPSAGVLSFKKPSAELTLKVKKTRDPSSEIIAEAWSSYSGNFLGTFFLKNKDRSNQMPDHPIIEPLWGEYKGKCDGLTSYLQIKVARTSSLYEGTENPYRSFRIFATFAEPDPSISIVCHHIPPRPCVKKIYVGGIYNFHSGLLELQGTPSRKCQVGATGINCEGCEYKRVSKPPTNRAWQRISHKDHFGDLSSGKVALFSGDALSGTYSGYLHHQLLNIYQTAQIRIESKRVGDTINLNAVAKLYFGDRHSNEAIDYRFDPQTLNAASSNPILLYTDGPRTDALLQITSLSEGEIRGIWYSSLYGKVGNFYLKTGDPPVLAKSDTVMEPVGAHYLWTVEGHNKPLDFDLYLPVIHEDVPPFVFPAQPFFPLDFNSYWTNRQGILQKKAFPGGSYDFFTGRISYGNVFLGFRKSRSEMSLVPAIPSTIGRPLGPDLPEPVTFIEPLEY